MWVGATMPRLRAAPFPAGMEEAAGESHGVTSKRTEAGYFAHSPNEGLAGSSIPLGPAPF